MAKTEVTPTVPIPQQKQVTDTVDDQQVQSENTSKDEPKLDEVKPDVKTDVNSGVKSDVKSDVKPDVTSDVTPDVKPDVEPKAESEKIIKAAADSSIKQPVIKLNRLSEEDQLLLQKSLKEFIETKPKLAKDMGIDLNDIQNEKSDSEDEEDGKRQKRKKRKRSGDKSDDDYQPDTFSALIDSKRRKVVNEEVPEIVIVKPKLRRVEKKFVPVLEKLSQEELMETNTYHKFNKSIEHVLRSGEDLDITKIGKNHLLPI